MQTLIEFISSLSEFIYGYSSASPTYALCLILSCKAKRFRDIRGIPSHMMTEIEFSER